MYPYSSSICNTIGRKKFAAVVCHKTSQIVDKCHIPHLTAADDIFNEDCVIYASKVVGAFTDVFCREIANKREPSSAKVGSQGICRRNQTMELEEFPVVQTLDMNPDVSTGEY